MITLCVLNEIGSYLYYPKKIDLDLKNRPTLFTKHSIEKPPMLELKILLSHLWYVFLSESNTLPMFIVANLEMNQVDALVSPLRRYKKPIGWMIVNIINIPSVICTHKI